MQIEVAVTAYKMVDVEVALDCMIPWCFEIVTGYWAEEYYLAEKDDVFLEVSQESLGSDNSLNTSALFFLECHDLKKNPNRRDVYQYIVNNKDRIIDYEKVSEYM